MRLVFMGTPAFVVPVLDALVNAPGVQVAGVYAPPDRPGGRGRRAEISPIKSYALEKGLALFQPSSLRTAESQEELAAIGPGASVRDRKDNHREKHDRQETGAHCRKRHTVR